MAYIFGSIWDRFNRNALNDLSKSVEYQGKSIQDLIAEGQLTPAQYATLIQTVNGLISKGDVSVLDINKNLGKFDSTYFSSDFIRDLNDGIINTTNVLNGSITTKKIAEKAVTPKETSFLGLGKNLFNKSTITPGFMVSSTSGNLVANANYNASDFIPVLPNTKYTRNTDYYMAFYDKDKAFISGFSINSGNLTFTTPANASYCRITNTTSSLDICQFELGAETTSYEPYQIKFNDVLLDEENLPKETLSILNDLQVKAKKNDSRFVESKNLFNKKTVTVGFIVSSTSGNLVANTAYSASDFIPIKSSTTYSRSSDYYMAFYDKDKAFISGLGINTGNLTFTTPANAAYLRVSVSTGSIDKFQLEEGNVSTPYEKYGTKLVGVEIGQVDAGTNYNPLRGKRGISFGDSITMGATFPSAISSRTGANIFNAGFGATRFTQVNAPESTYPYYKLGMCEISDAIATGDWTIMQPYIDEVDVLRNDSAFSSIYSGLKAINFNTVDFITIMYGTNDLNNGSSLVKGDIDGMDTTTVYGALNYIITNILTAYPNIQIYLMTPIFKNVMTGGSPEGNSDEVNMNGLYLYEIAEGIVESAKKWHIPVKDMYNESGINRLTANQYLKDGVHPNENGNKRLDKIVQGFLTNQ